MSGLLIKVETWVRPSNLALVQGGIYLFEGITLCFMPSRIVENLVSDWICKFFKKKRRFNLKKFPALGIDKPELCSAYKIIGLYLVMSLAHYYITASSRNNESFMANSIMNRAIIFGGMAVLRYFHDVPNGFLYIAGLDVFLALMNYMSLERFGKAKGRRRE
ncbi:hypothetical protein G9A89_008337 [Geosiphon pyriformis]|nr:hypothetical protein G9A89_008337 [Geosiphon pyriformis]